MKYGQIAGNTKINATIYYCFEHMCEDDERKFVKKFREQPHDSDQIMHTFRELVLGAYLIASGFRVRYDCVIHGQAPDWSILETEGESISAVVELTSFHIDKAAETEIEEQMHIGGMAFHWRDKSIDNVERLYHSIWRKASVYKSLTERLQVPYVVGVFGEFTAAVDLEEVRLCLFDEETGLFGMHPELSGVMYFEEVSGQYSFNYLNNAGALRGIELPSGIFRSEEARTRNEKQGAKVQD
jgi:hypothetical protein